MNKILIIEDETAIAELEKDYLELSNFEVTICNDGLEGSKLALNEDFDLILLDLMLPNMDGFEICKLIRDKKNTPIIMVSAKKDDIDKIHGLGLGADDYITKPYNPTILLLRIQNIFKRMDNNMDDLFYDNISVNPQKGILKQGEKVLELTKNEMIIFTYLLSNRGRIVTRDDLMTDLWNNDEFINDNALTVNISRLRNKLQNFGLENRIETRKGQGYKLL